jgi:hypothetical protein
MKKSIKSLERTMLIAMMLFVSCTNDNYDEYYGGTCDVDNVTYSATVAPIIKNQCFACHNSTFANGGVLLETWDDVKKQVDNGKLLGVIKHLPGYSPMPQGGKLDDCTILKIETWINNGALNN